MIFSNKLRTAMDIEGISPSFIEGHVNDIVSLLKHIHPVNGYTFVNITKSKKIGCLRKLILKCVVKNEYDEVYPVVITITYSHTKKTKYVYELQKYRTNKYENTN